jgi:hypothetical protein
VNDFWRCEGAELGAITAGMHDIGELNVSLSVLHSGLAERTVCLLVLHHLVLVLLALLLDLVLVALLVLVLLIPYLRLLPVLVWSFAAQLADLLALGGAVLLRLYDSLANLLELVMQGVLQLRFGLLVEVSSLHEQLQ